MPRIVYPSMKRKNSKYEMVVVIGSTGAKEYTEKIKEVTGVYVQYKKFNNFSFIKFICICLNLEILTITYSSSNR